MAKKIRLFTVVKLCKYSCFRYSNSRNTLTQCCETLCMLAASNCMFFCWITAVLQCFPLFWIHNTAYRMLGPQILPHLLMQKAIAQNGWAHDALQHMSGIILQKISCWLAVIKMCNAGPVKTVRICLSKTLPATSSSTKQLCPKQET